MDLSIKLVIFAKKDEIFDDTQMGKHSIVKNGFLDQICIYIMMAFLACYFHTPKLD
ncbi:hypothetical protein RND71_007074 [Anisodus tanguticus]|uniref:Uncharacterized protein n=1 Tax=Anisodus tanguticus TaxID=243964 RepID=A0AAE1SL60_9SOLA|nr:hypothetical protein RND71_007074 [Anisodus tanguticus]